MNKRDSQKEDSSIAEQEPFIHQSDPYQTKIHTLVPQSIQAIETILPKHSSLFNEEKAVSDRIIENDQQNQNKQEPQIKRKQSQRSDSYHRVDNSRRIKTKKARKDDLPRSDFFYFDNMYEQLEGEEGHIDSLLKEYEAFHQMIKKNDFSLFENRIIKLSHYGNNNKHKHQYQKSNESSVRMKSQVKEEKISGLQKSFKQSESIRFAANKSKKVVLQTQSELKQSLVGSRKQSSHGQNQCAINKNRQNKNNISNIYPHRKNPLPLPIIQTLSKYTTPIRTIYLNKGQQSPHQQKHHKSHSSSGNKLSTSTMLRSDRTRIGENLFTCVSSAIKRESNQNDQNEEQVQNQNIHICLIGKKSIDSIERGTKDQQKNNLSHQASKLGLSIVSSHKKWTNCKLLSTQISKSNNLGNLDVSKFRLDLTKLKCDKADPNSNLLHTTSLLHSNRHSQSRSKSRKGLSLTQSSSNIFLKSKSQIFCPNSISKICPYADIQKQNDIVVRKLDPKGIAYSKRVEIRIY